MSGKEQNPHLLTNESKDCDLVSLFSLGCGLAKLQPCACRGDEPQPHPRASQQPSCAEPGTIHTADHLPELWGQKNQSKRQQVPPDNHKAPPTPRWAKGSQRQVKSRARAVAEPTQVHLPGVCAFTPPKHSHLPKETAIFINTLNCSQVITFRKFSCCQMIIYRK